MPLTDLGDGGPSIDLPEGFTFELARMYIERGIKRRRARKELTMSEPNDRIVLPDDDDLFDEPEEDEEDDVGAYTAFKPLADALTEVGRALVTPPPKEVPTHKRLVELAKAGYDPITSRHFAHLAPEERQRYAQKAG